jgi:branched-chain amino acid transport system permease protein
MLARLADRATYWRGKVIEGLERAGGELRATGRTIAGRIRYSPAWKCAADAAWPSVAVDAARRLVERLRRPKPISVEGRYRVEVATPASRSIAIAGMALLVLLIALPAFAERHALHDLIFVFTMLALAQYWNLLAGFAGLVSVGQQAFVGLGGYLLFALTIHSGIDPLLAILLAGVVAGAIALPTAFVVFRLRGAYFAIGTWVMAEVYRLVFAQFKQLGGGTGTSLPAYVTNEVAGIGWVRVLFDVRTAAARDIITYWAALAIAVATLTIVYLILRSRHGLALAAIRDSEEAAESVGVDNLKTKLAVYVVTATATGMVGALIYLQKARISPDAAFSVLDWTAYVIFIVVIGGIGTIEGPIVGVLVFYLLQTNLAHFGTWYLILLGGFGIAIMLFAPKGIWGYLSEKYEVVIFPIRRRLHPQLATDAGSKDAHV